MLSTKALYAILLALIIVLGITLSIKTALGPNNFLDFWDDSYYIFFSHYIANYGFNKILLANFATEYILVGVPAIIYKLLGVSLLTEGIFSMLCLTGTVITIFMIGKLLHNELAGILSALTFVFVPLVAAEGSASGDNMAVAFFITLAVLLLLLGAKKKKSIYYLLSGFIGLTGVLAGSALNLLVFMFLIPYIIYLLLKERNVEQKLHTLAFFWGMLLAIALIITLGYILQSKPFIYFVTNYYVVKYPASNTPTLLKYIALLFPFPPHSGVPSWFFWPLISGFSNGVDINVIGFFGYAMLASLAYLLAKKKYDSALLLSSWFGLMFMYLSFGKDSFSGGYMLFVERFTIILLPPMAIIIGLALSMIVEDAFKIGKRGRSKRHVALHKVLFLFAMVAYAIMVINSLMLMKFIHASNYILTYQWQQVANVLLTLPKNASIYFVSGLSAVPGIISNQSLATWGVSSIANFISSQNFLEWMAIEGYGGYKINANYSAVFSNCSDIKGDYFVVINTSYYKNNFYTCNNFSIYYSPVSNQSIVNYFESIGLGPESQNDQITIYKAAK